MKEEEIELQWQKLINLVKEKTGSDSGFEGILLFIGIRESGMPHKPFSEVEEKEFIQIAICTILVPARYYELFWVEDTGWPHYKQLQRVPSLSNDQMITFLKPWIIKYVEKNRFF